MQPDEFEACREAGAEYRRGLTHAVMAAVALPATWMMNGLYSGLFPVQVRFAPAYGRFRMALCSPGEISDRWLLLMMSSDGFRLTCIRSRPRFEPETFSAALSLAAVMDGEGYNVRHIMDTLTGDDI